MKLPLIVLLLVYISFELEGSQNCVSAYILPSSLHPKLSRGHSILGNRKIDDDDDDDEQVFTKKKGEGTELNDDKEFNYLDDLTPPPVNFARNSILFSENPSTKLRNNPPLKVWKVCRSNLPAVLTGAWPWRDIESLDERPLAALYNAFLVRLPVLAVAASYLYQKIAEGHDLVIDLRRFRRFWSLPSWCSFCCEQNEAKFESYTIKNTRQQRQQQQQQQ
eukprot:CAMPEP_0116109612 /NCGR_PEP_ID=MMETSP0327-20121206/17423_1 /TAXON_ID=44447 /ORGANISM="Pseudo-nitzschia delicatissima, Strain B596" /LENGTH=219 /DNA_ID=CAMNT_0003602625 /DNA_START=57 /DNA_END=713 /DNA_ORIENTATION=-